MIDFRSLDRETRTVALVGRFLQLWAHLEMAIGHAIGTTLRLTKLQEYILTKNVGFINQTYILGALCAVAELNDDEQRDSRLLFQSIRDFYGNRNIVAHEAFVDCTRTDGVEFLVMRAKGKIDFPDVQWSVDHFEKLYLGLIEFQLGINTLSERLRRARRPEVNALAALLAAIPSEPTEEPIGLGSLGLLALQPQVDRTSETTSSTPKIDPETPPSPGSDVSAGLSVGMVNGVVMRSQVHNCPP